MRKFRRVLAAAVSGSMALGTGVTAVAHADAGAILYVNNGFGSTVHCTDTGVGAGSAATPYCTIGAAAKAAVPGDAVDIAPGDYAGAVTISAVGTAAAPIVFRATGTGTIDITDATGESGPALTFDGASYVEFEGSVGVGATQDQRISIAGVLVRDSAHLTLDSVGVSAGTAVEMVGTTSNVAITRSALQSSGTAVLIAAGGSDNVISTNLITVRYAGPGILLEGAAGTDITANTVNLTGTGPTISVTSASTGTSIENNVLYGGISVDPTSLTGTTEDYNVLSSAAPYQWDGTAYPNQPSYTAASHQGAHDLLVDAQLDPAPYTVGGAAPQLNSANSAAPGMLPTDIYGRPCKIDPVLAKTGVGPKTYCDRGALQQTYTTALKVATATQWAMTVDLRATMLQTTVGPNGTLSMKQAPTPAVSYLVAWGDGTSSPSTPGSADHTFTGIDHTYPAMGTYQITVTAKLTDLSTRSTSYRFTTTGDRFVPFGPRRMLDTRKGLGAPQAKVVAGHSVSLQLAGVDGIPANVDAVALNLTATDGTGNGLLAITRPSIAELSTSSLHYLRGQNVANAVFAKVTKGRITIYNQGAGAADIIADVTGYFTRTAGDGYAPVTLKRILDTRDGTGARRAQVAANAAVPVAVAGVDGIPAGVTAVAVHVTVVDTTGSGWIGAEPDGAGRPGTSFLNYLGDQIVSDTVIVPVGKDGKIALYNGGGHTPVDLVADLDGYFAPTAKYGFVPLELPFRVWDSRVDSVPLPANGANLYRTTSGDLYDPQLPPNSVTIVNITLTDEKANGYITVYPYGTRRPYTSNLNYWTGRNIAGLSILNTTGSGEEVSIYNGSPGTSDVVLDLFGYFATE